MNQLQLLALLLALSAAVNIAFTAGLLALRSGADAVRAIRAGAAAAATTMAVYFTAVAAYR